MAAQEFLTFDVGRQGEGINFIARLEKIFHLTSRKDNVNGDKRMLCCSIRCRRGLNTG